MDYKEFYDRLGNNTLPNVVLMEGEEQYVKERALTQLLDKLLPQAVRDINLVLLPDGASAGSIIEACETLPFLSEKRIVLVRECPFCLPGARKEEGADELSEYVKAMPEHALLIFYLRYKADARKKLPAALIKMGARVSFARLSPADRQAFLTRMAREGGKAFASGALNHLMLSGPEDLGQMVLEMEKLLAYAGEGDAITRDMVDACVTPSVEYGMFSVIDAVMARDAAQTMQRLTSLIARGESRIALLIVLSRSLRRMLHLKLLQAQNAPSATALSTLGVSPQALSVISRQAARFSIEGLKQLLELSSGMDYKIKSGQIREEAALDLVVMTMLSHSA